VAVQAILETAVSRINTIDDLGVDIDGGAAEGDDAIEGVVRTADGLRSAAGSTDTDTGNGRAGHANLAGHAAGEDAKGAEQSRDGGRGRRLDRVAALLVADVARGCRRGRIRQGEHCGGSKDGNERKDFVEQHIVCLREKEIKLARA